MTTTVENSAGATEAHEPAEQAPTVDAPEQKPAGADVEDVKPDEQEKPDTDWRAMARKHEDRWKALAAETETLRKQLETANSAAGRVTDLEAQATAAEKRAVRAELAAEVSTAKGVKLRYLAGETREELEAAADAWLEDAKSVASRVGVVPTQGTGDPAPRTSSYASGAERARAQLEKNK